MLKSLFGFLLIVAAVILVVGAWALVFALRTIILLVALGIFAVGVVIITILWMLACIREGYYRRRLRARKSS